MQALLAKNAPQLLMDGRGPSAASPGESSHVVGFLLRGLDEAQELELRHGPDETSAGELVEERRFL